MTNLKQVVAQVRKGRKNGFSDNAIAKQLGVSAPEIRRLLSGKYPGEKVAARIGIPVVCHTCHRRIPIPRVKIVPKDPAPHIAWWRSLSEDERDQYIKRLHRQLDF